MDTKKLTVNNSTITFLYINYIHETNTWASWPSTLQGYKINFFIEGDIDVIIDNLVYSPQKYDFVVYPPLCQYYGKIKYKQNLEYFEFVIPVNIFAGIDSDNTINQALKRLCVQNLFSLDSENTKLAIHKFYDFRDAVRNRIPDIYLIAKFIDLIAVIGNAYVRKPSHDNVKNLSKNLFAITEYMDKNACTLTSIKEVSENMHFSQSYISRLFRNEIGCSAYQYLLDLKLTYSLKLLNQGKNVTEACYESGFNSCSVYIEAFKRKFNMTPNQYKSSANYG